MDNEYKQIIDKFSKSYNNSTRAFIMFVLLFATKHVPGTNQDGCELLTLMEKLNELYLGRERSNGSWVSLKRLDKVDFDIKVLFEKLKISFGNMYSTITCDDKEFTNDNLVLILGTIYGKDCFELDLTNMDKAWPVTTDPS